MSKNYRYLLFVICAVQLLFAAGFFWQLPFAINLWPLPDTTPLTFIFIASIFAAAAASTLWAAASKNDGALAGIGLDYLCILGPMAIFLLTLSNTAAGAMITRVGIGVFFGAVFGAGLWLWSRRIPIRSAPPMPNIVWWSFIVFIVALLAVSGQLLFNVPNVIPWTITPEIAVIIAWIFFGAAVYFLYGVLKPSWANAAGQLAGFLAYDLVLIGPFVTRLPTIAQEHRTGMIFYIIVVVYSGLLAMYYLFVAKPTRIWS